VQSERWTDTRSNIQFNNSIDDLTKCENKGYKTKDGKNPFVVQSEKKINSFGIFQKK